MILSSHWKHQTGIAIKSWFCAVILCRQVLKIMTVLWFKETRSFALPKFGNLHSNTLASLRIGEVLASLANFGNWRSHLFYATCWQIGCSATRAIYKKSYSPSVDESGGYLHEKKKKKKKKKKNIVPLYFFLLLINHLSHTSLILKTAQV